MMIHNKNNDFHFMRHKLLLILSSLHEQPPVSAGKISHLKREKAYGVPSTLSNGPREEKRRDSLICALCNMGPKLELAYVPAVTILAAAM